MRLEAIVVGTLLAALAITAIVVVWRHAPDPFGHAVVEGLAGPQPVVTGVGAQAAAPVPKRPALDVEPISTTLRFDFDDAELDAAHAAKLEALLSKLKGKGVRVDAIGHADRIGPAAYNMRLSERRAAAVKEYLVKKDLSAETVHTAGRGELEPVSGDACFDLAPATRLTTALIACLQRDRRVEVTAEQI